MTRGALVLVALACLPGTGVAKGRASGPLHLRAPTELARTERVVTEDSGYENQTCAPALAYGKGPTAIFSIHRASLKASGRLPDVERFLSSGAIADANALKLMDLVCSDANVVADLPLGPAKSTVFDQQQLFLGDASQDGCGNIDVMAVARKTDHYFVLTVRLESLMPSGCDVSSHGDEQACARRDSCLKTFFAKPAHAADLKSKWTAFLKTLRFGD